MTNLETSLLHHLNEFLAFARGRLGDPDLAADVVQESLLKALKSAPESRDVENVRAWFYQILRRTIIDLHRRKQTEASAAEKLGLEFDLRPGSEDERTVCACLDRLVPTLKPEYATLIQRVDLAGESPESVSVELAITRNNLTVRLHRARQQLKERLESTCRMCATHGCLDCTCDPQVEGKAKS
jgi:RNA polymerase sigma factor (sigma-70 family)